MGDRIIRIDGTEHHFPDDFTDDEIAAALSETKTAPYRDPRAMLGDAVIGAGKSLLSGIKNHPVEAGGIAGGLLAAPFTGGMSAIPAMAATGLAGAAGAGVGVIGKRLGEAATTGDMHTPIDTTDAAKQMATQGLEQAGAEGGGRMIRGTLRMLGNRVYQGILKPTQAARLEHPELVQTALENAIPVSAGGAEKAGTLMGESRQAADALVADRAAQPGAPTIDPKQAVGGITKAVKDVRDLPVSRPQMAAIGDYARQYLKEHPSAMALPDAQRAVRATDKFFDSTYRATMDRGNPVTSGSTAAAVGINDETRKLLRAAVPGLKEQNAVTSGLAGVREAVERRVGQQGNLSPIGMQHLINAGLGSGVGAIGGKEKGLTTFAAMEALTNPMIGSRLAIGGHMAAGLPWAQAVRAALLARLSGEEEKQHTP